MINQYIFLKCFFPSYMWVSFRIYIYVSFDMCRISYLSYLSACVHSYMWVSFHIYIYVSFDMYVISHKCRISVRVFIHICGSLFIYISTSLLTCTSYLIFVVPQCVCSFIYMGLFSYIHLRLFGHICRVSYVLYFSACVHSYMWVSFHIYIYVSFDMYVISHKCRIWVRVSENKTEGVEKRDRLTY